MMGLTPFSEMKGAFKAAKMAQGLEKAAGKDAAQGLAEGAAKEATQLSKEAQKGVKSLEKQIASHEKKLEEFRNNPTVRPGMENLPKDVIEKQQQRRIQHLETEIQTFKNNLQKILDGEL
ncbi:hypothetical protein [Paludibacterium paludis]|uniref:hypothetical protein n=1 Tax=Paludibacterium paludis TaxID=1225769 RepID=UPI001679C81B|nr:hypothetical protein [Paludibacterium paludis]